MSFYDRHPIFAWFLIGVLVATFVNPLWGATIVLTSPIIGTIVRRGGRRG